MAGTTTAGQVDLSRLDAFLMSDRTSETSMSLSTLDGFLTGIAVTPELLVARQWLPRVWGDHEPVFDSFEEAQAILSVILGRYSEILTAVQRGPDHIDPVFRTGADGETVIAADWAEGFVAAIKLRPEAWRPLVQDRAAVNLLVPIAGLCADASGGPVLARHAEGSEANAAELLADAPAMIPVCVAAIEAYWREHTAPFLAGPLQRGRKVGRNEPCPCGSGRKYKRCCGAN